jgi:superfamily II DNA or RNA helicase
VPLHKRSSSHFQAGDRERGTQYFREGRVQFEVDGDRCLAHVAGTKRRSYGVGLDWSRVAATRALHAFCECQRFADGRPCKHLWATLLALSEAGPDVHPPGKDRVGLRRDGASKWRDLGISAADPPVREPRDTGRGPSARRPPRPRHGRHLPGPEGEAAGASWRAQLVHLRDEVERLSRTDLEAAGSPSDLAASGVRFMVNTTATLDTSGLVLDVFTSRRSGAEDRLQRVGVDAQELERLLQPAGPAAAGRPVGVVTAIPVESPYRPPGRGRRGPRQSPPSAVRRLRLPPQLYDSVLPHLCAEDALGWWEGRSRDDLHPLSWDAGAPWQLVLRLVVTAGTARLSGSLERDGQSVGLSTPVLILPIRIAHGGADGSEPESPALVLFPETIARLEAVRERELPWIELLREKGEIVIAKDDLAEALTSLFEIPGLPRIEVPEELQLAEESSPLRPRLLLESDLGSVLPDPPLLARLSYTYGNLEVSAEDPRPSLIDWQERTFLRRDMESEHRALVRLLEAGVRPVASGEGHELELSSREMPAVAESLLADGWTVEVRGTSLRAPSPPSLRVETGIDWFEVSGSTDFAGDTVELKRILEAVSRGDRFVKLSDGSQGLLPASWMETYDSLAKLAHGATEDGLRFLPSQALLVDAQLKAMPPTVDRAFAALREKLRSFESIKPKKEPRGFRGTLRGYQRDGLGWLDFLREFGLGGILADDMGLGKTVQVLALLRANRTPSKSTGLPSLVVAPRSLVYNWIEESARFTPTLSIVEYRGPEREALRDRFQEIDVVVTTYATMRLDIDFLATVGFDTVVLDEAQAIKNRDSQSAKASRLLVARHRLALTGTPIENHLGELGSIFEFLNPGLLGSMPRLDALSAGRAASREELATIAAGIRPFILRRTKAQVLQDLPPKTEQVLYCTLTPAQRELYDKLRAGYQASLLGEIEAKGVGGSAIQVLEALLRLRQIACHPGLVDTEWEAAGSAKLEALFEQVAEVLEEGHKLLVFSQFTKLLAYVRRHLDDTGVPYAYLDGQTRDRGEVVERFQTDASCNIFLISLKAGGLGLNLTAAGYVFLLDPWWNPAVEAQAIDRAHRIGQTQPVFSYRLIARDTVEERILELQHSKRQLADALLDGAGLPLKELTADDLRMLLS